MSGCASAPRTPFRPILPSAPYYCSAPFGPCPPSAPCSLPPHSPLRPSLPSAQTSFPPEPPVRGAGRAEKCRSLRVQADSEVGVSRRHVAGARPSLTTRARLPLACGFPPPLTSVRPRLPSGQGKGIGPRSGVYLAAGLPGCRCCARSGQVSLGSGHPWHGANSGGGNEPRFRPAGEVKNIVYENRGVFNKY